LEIAVKRALLAVDRSDRVTPDGARIQKRVAVGEKKIIERRGLWLPASL
jgi:hypothetical protein